MNPLQAFRPRRRGRQRFVVVGGGLAASRAVMSIRKAGHEGPITMIGEERSLPYDRPPLSKDVLVGAVGVASAQLHPREWYDDLDVDLRLGQAAIDLDLQRRRLTLADGDTVPWDRLLLATGSAVRRLFVPGADLANILSLRTAEDSQVLRDRLLTGAPLVIIGAGWIGLEVAAAARTLGCEVTIVEPQAAPLANLLGTRLGEYVAELHRRHGVRLLLGDSVHSFVGPERVRGVVTAGGEQLMADTVLVGVGVTPNTHLARHAGLTVDDGIVVDASLRTSASGVYAAGDVACRFHPLLGRRIRVDHWTNAFRSGYLAGRAMAGEDVSFEAVPAFFSHQYDVTLEYLGYIPPDTETELVLRGDTGTDEFGAFWLSKGRVLAGMHVNSAAMARDIEELVRNGPPVDPRRLADEQQPLLVRSVSF